MSEEERLSSDADFKPNLVNSVCYLVEQVRALFWGRGGGSQGGACSLISPEPYHIMWHSLLNSLPGL